MFVDVEPLLRHGGWGGAGRVRDTDPSRRLAHKTHRSPAALFTMAGRWEQPRCPSVDEWTSKTWSIQTRDW